MSDIERLIEASSLGTPDAVAMRERTTPEHARRVMARAKEIGQVMAVADVIRAYLDAECAEVSRLLFNAEVEEIAARVLPVARRLAGEGERHRVAAYLERAGAQKRRNALDSVAPLYGEIEERALREAADWCRDDTIWVEDADG